MRGSDAARTARARALRRRQTEVERRLWHRISNRQMDGFKFVRQEPIGPYIADFVCRECRLVVELDGSQHADSARDRIRDAYLASRGYRVLRFWNTDVTGNFASVLDAIHAHLTGVGLDDADPSRLPGNGAGSPLPAGGERAFEEGKRSETERG